MQGKVGIQAHSYVNGWKKTLELYSTSNIQQHLQQLRQPSRSMLGDPRTILLTKNKALCVTLPGSA